MPTLAVRINMYFLFDGYSAGEGLAPAGKNLVVSEKCTIIQLVEAHV